MLGLLGVLELGQRSLQVQRKGVEVAGHNLANVNNPAYARQRLKIESCQPIESNSLQIGTGADAAAILQIRNTFVDRQIQGEASVTGFLEARQFALQYAQAELGQTIDRQASGAEGASAASGAGGQHAIAESVSELFNAFQSLSARPADPVERQLVIQKAQTLAVRFRQTGQRLQDLATGISDALSEDIGKANTLLTEIAEINERISLAEAGGSGMANDLRDARQAKIEELSKLVKIETGVETNGRIDISVSGVLLVDGADVQDSLAAVDTGDGRLVVGTRNGGAVLNVTAGHVYGLVTARDEDIKGLQTDLDNLAGGIISTINGLHRGGFGLSGSTGADFFTGARARDIEVNANLVTDPAKIQASGVAGAVGDNTVILAMARLADQVQPSLNGLTFSQSYSRTVAGLGQALARANAELSDQNLVTDMLQSQRESASGVSLDEEMTELMKYQRAYQASARIITTVDQMFDEVLNLKR